MIKKFYLKNILELTRQCTEVFWIIQEKAVNSK